MAPSSPLPADAQIIDGVWHQVLRPDAPPGPRPALFLDRDGVIIHEVNYLGDPEQVVLEAGAIEVIGRANALGIAVVVVTNQAGIGYGYYQWHDFQAVQARMLDLLSVGGVFLDAVFACPFHARATGQYQHLDHPYRKPNPGMLLAAQPRLNLDLASSWIVGDRASDIAAGRNSGLAGGLQVRSGHGAVAGEEDRSRALACDTYRVLIGNNIADALDLVPLLGTPATG